jgi:hypothetical protein
MGMLYYHGALFKASEQLCKSLPCSDGGSKAK